MLTFLGDVFLKDPVAIDAELPGAVVFNLEAPLTRAKRGYPRKINLRADPANLSASFKEPPLAVSLANNHMLDFYEEGLESTFEVLDAAGVKYFGAGRPETGHGNPLLIEHENVTVALLAYADRSSGAVFSTEDATWIARLRLEQVVSDIDAAKAAGAERVVVNAHWGYEHVTLPSVKHVILARQIVDAGADLVIGHHSHCIQGYETYSDVPIFYGLGNCIFPSHNSDSYFNEDGVSTRKVDSRAAPWNRTSLAVSWSPVSGEFAVKPLVFIEGRLKKGRFGVEGYRLNIASLDDYAGRFNRAFRWGKLRHSLARFVSQPKIPRLSHLKGVGKDMRSLPPT